VVVFVSSFVLSLCLRRKNKKMDEAEAMGFAEEEAIGVKVGIERLNEHATVGRRLGGANSGATARYDT